MGGPVFADYIVKIYEPYRRGERYIAAFRFTSRCVDTPSGIQRNLSLLSGPLEEAQDTERSEAWKVSLEKSVDPTQIQGEVEQFKMKVRIPLESPIEDYFVSGGRADITRTPSIARSKGHKGQVAQDRSGAWDLGGGLIVKHHKLARVIEHLGSVGFAEVSRDGLRTALRDVAHQRKSN